MSTAVERQPVYVWDAVVRSTHWAIVASILVLSATGFYLGRPFFSVSGPAGQSFFTGWVKVVHFYGAIVFSVAVLARIIWMFLGPGYARWTQLIPVAPQRRRDLWGTFQFYSFMKPEPPPAIGHNALAGLTYVAIFGLYFVMIATGFAIYSADATIGSPLRAFGFLQPLFGGLQSARWVHHVVMYLLLGFMVHHVYSALLMSQTEKNGCLDSIFSGWKYVPKEGPRD